MNNSAIIKGPDLQLFGRLAAPYLRGVAVRGSDPRASRNRPGPGLEVLDLRSYQPGDDIRHIDWRQTARRKEAVVRRFRNEATADWFVCVDCSASVGLHASKWSMTTRLATALAYACLFSGHRVAMLLFSDRIKGVCQLGRGATHFAALLNLLQENDVAVSGAARNTRDSGTGDTRRYRSTSNQSNLGLCRDFLSRSSNVFVVSDFLQADGMRPHLQSLKSAASSTSAIQVLAADEVDVAVTGITRLQDVETAEHRSILMSDQTVEDAKLALSAHSERLRKDCGRLGIRFTSCQSTDIWQQVLVEHLGVRA